MRYILNIKSSEFIRKQTTLKFENKVSLIHERTICFAKNSKEQFAHKFDHYFSWTHHGGQGRITGFLVNCDLHFFTQRIWMTSEDLKYRARAVWASSKLLLWGFSGHFGAWQPLILKRAETEKTLGYLKTNSDLCSTEEKFGKTWG